MTFLDNLKDAIGDLLRGYGVDVVKVLDYEEVTEYGGYCETCAYEEVILHITYLDSNANVQKYRYWSNFADLIRALDKVDV